MADIDMIPRSYREALRVERAVRRFAIALAALLLLGGAAAGLLRWRVAHDEPRLAQLRAAAAQAGGDTARLAALQARHDALGHSVASLDTLRAAGVAGRLAGALEGALGPDMWLTAIRYARSEVPIPAGQPELPGDLSVPPAAGAAPETWRVTHRVDLGGAAFSYPALTEFLRGFAAQPGVADVRLVDSSAPQGDVSAIGFNVTALVGATTGAKP